MAESTVSVNTVGTVSGIKPGGESHFDGGLLQLVGWLVLGFLITVCTFGICYPWAICLIYRWEANRWETAQV